MRLCFGAFSCATLSLGLAAWQASVATQNPQTFTAGIDVVKLDVSVYGPDHRPIKGLTAADFTLLEDKLPRPIVGFAEIDIPEPPAPTATWMRDATDDVATNDVAEKRLFVIVIDDHSFAVPRPSRGQRAPSLDPPSALAFKVNRDALIVAVESFINRLGPLDLAAIVFGDDGRFNQDFTADHARLRAAIEKGLKDEPYFNFTADSDAVLYTMIDDLLRVPAKRKAVVDFTNQLECLTGPTATSGDHLFQAAQRANARFYMMRPSAHVPVCGVSGMETTDLSKVAQDALMLTAAPLATGGEAFAGVYTPAVAEAAALRIIEANSSYYMLGYTSADLNKIHFTTVTVDRPGAEVKTRPRYLPPAAERVPAGPPPPATVAAIAGVLPQTDIPLRASAAVFAPTAASPGSQAAATAAIVLQVRYVRPPKNHGPVRETLDLRASTFTSDGDPRGVAARTADIRLPPGNDDVTYEILERIDLLKPGVYNLRLSAHSAARDASGGVYVTVDVPDFAKAPLSLSNLVLSADNGLAIDGVDLLRALLPMTPTAVRTFDRGEAVTAFVRAYEGGSGAIKPLTVRTRIVDEHDAPVVDRTETVDKTRFDRARSAQLFTRLPTATLRPGDYLLSIAATLGQINERREIKFTIK